MNGKMNINYDEENDYLEIFIEGSSPTCGEERGNDITLFRKEGTDEVVGVGILNFKKRTKSLHNLRLDLPFVINFSELKL